MVSLAWVALAACGDDGGAAVDAAIAIDAAIVIDAGIDAVGSQCTRQPCSILPQCGCDDPATPVCDLDLTMLATGGTKCRADNFHGTETTLCTRSSTCAAEYTCLGRCLHYCDSDDDCPGPGGLCIIPLGNTGGHVPGVMTCTTDCVPSLVANPTCPTAWGCHLYQEAGGDRRWLTNCEAPPQAGGALGDACTQSIDCGPGLDCFNDGSGMGRRCRPNCLCPGGDCTVGVCPAGGGTCHGYTPAALVGTATYGRCY